MCVKMFILVIWGFFSTKEIPPSAGATAFILWGALFLISKGVYTSQLPFLVFILEGKTMKWDKQKQTNLSLVF